ncbi:MAG: carbon-nitrogen hydrolase family protein [Oscillospiraceae bacterium]|nr:carbon-nitrogen hydrolase family protein [Oscillospiraceae bacterium]
MSIIKTATLQLSVSEDKRANLKRLSDFMDKPELSGADLITVGEMFSCPYDTLRFPEYAEPMGGESFLYLSELSEKHGVYLSAGSIPERGEDGKIYNTAYVFGRDGKCIAAHRKMHLFDVNIKGGQYFKESDTLSPGNSVTVFDTEFGKMGLCICFDFRFPELSRLMALKGARLIIVPGAFNMTSGPAHWELLFRARAMDNQLFTLGTSPARNEKASYVAYGHSICCDPWGKTIFRMDEKEGICLAEIDLDYADEIRSQLPLLSARRDDVYSLSEIK